MTEVSGSSSTANTLYYNIIDKQEATYIEHQLPCLNLHHLHTRAYSSGKPSPFNEEAVNSNLFDKAKATPLPSEEAGEAAERLAAEPSTAGGHQSDYRDV